MELAVRDTTIHFVEHGQGTPVVVLHGAGVDHREAEACFEPGLGGGAGFRRIYPDLPGMGRTAAPESLSGAGDVLHLLLDFLDAIAPSESVLLAGHSAGAYYAQAIAAARPEKLSGLALVCPLLPDTHDVPPHRPLVADDGLGDQEFRDYFVLQTPEMLDRYERFVAPAILLVDEAASARIGADWDLPTPDGPPFDGPVLLVAGRLDATVGSAATVDASDRYPHATLAVLEDAGHALPHERNDMLSALLRDWQRRATPARATG